MSTRTHNTLKIEALIKTGATVSSIAREAGVSRKRVQQIRLRLQNDYQLVTESTPMGEAASTPTPAGLVSSSGMATLPKTLTLHLTPPVHDALSEACAIANRQNPEDTITLTEYVEELVINRVVELGLLRRNKRK